MIHVLGKLAQLNIKYRKKWGPHNRCLHRGPTRRIYGPAPKFSRRVFLVLPDAFLH